MERLKIPPEHSAQVYERWTEDGNQITSFWCYSLSLGDKGSGCITDERPNRSRVTRLQRAPPILRISEVSVLRNVSVRCWTELLSPEVQELKVPPPHTQTCTHSSTHLAPFTPSLTLQFFIINIYTNFPVSHRTSTASWTPTHTGTHLQTHTHTDVRNQASIIDTFPSTLSKNSLISFASWWCPPSAEKHRWKRLKAWLLH